MTHQTHAEPDPGPIVLEGEGLRLLDRRRRRRRDRFVAYEDVTHVAAFRRGLAIGTRDDVIVVGASAFGSPERRDAIAAALRTRIAQVPGGMLRIARMARLDRVLEQPRERIAVLAFAALCVVAFVVEVRDPAVLPFASFMPALAQQGELWRLATGNLLHDPLLFPLHIGLNLLCIVGAGLMVERVLGSLRTIVVMGLSGLCAMLAAGWAGYGDVVGASGVAAGLFGALLCIELHGAERLPALWRIPRRLFVTALLLQASVDLLVPIIASAAHLGGFAAGYLVTRLQVGHALRRRPPTAVALAGALCVVSALILSILSVAPLISREAGALERHALRLLIAPDSSIDHDNLTAWLLVAETQPTEVGVQAALALAERAVYRSGHSNPDLLDTLAEALFVAGDVDGALEIIDQAISLAYDEPYFHEQRRRYTGERAADDRPDPPVRRLPEVPGESWSVDPGEPGIEI